MTKEYGVDLAPEPLMAAQTIILPTGAEEWAEKHLEPFDAKKHNTKVVVAELLPIHQRCDVIVEPNARTYTDSDALCERAATESEVFDRNNHEVRWCETCAAVCPFARNDHLVVCKHYNELTQCE